MGTHVIKMPDIGEGIVEVELVEWFVKVGDVVKEDQVVADVMTDKATVEIPSPVAGTVMALGGEPGQVLTVGSELIRLEVEGQGNVRYAAPVPCETPAVAEPVPAPTQPAQQPPTATAAPLAAHPPLAAPAVRKRAQDLGLALADIHGSGPDGRVLHEDLDRLLGRQPAAHHVSRELIMERIPVTGLRKRIAQRMQDAKRRVAHFSYVEEVDVTALEALRQSLNQRHAEQRGKLTLLPFLARALVVALVEYPRLNAHYDDEAQVILQHNAVHLGIATQSDDGLMVPVLRHAEQGDLWQHAREIARLAEAARQGRATRDELSGSTITLTSLGNLGGIVSTPVVNVPEVAIIGVNRMVERPVVIDGQIVVRKMMNLSSSFDHRVVDGMDAARFIQTVKGLLEQPATLFID